MQTILIAQQNDEFAEGLAAPLRDAGYRVITCPGPWPPELRCILCDTGYCPLTDAADLLIYDPDLTALDSAGDSQILALQTATVHQELPMLLAWPSDERPERVDVILREAPQVQPARRTGAELVAQVRELLAPVMS